MTAGGRNAYLDRAVAVPRLIGDPDDFLIVAGLAGTSVDVHALAPGAANAFLIGGAMGAAVSVGLGLALAQPDRRVLVVTGDGELMMNLGALATVAAMAPKRLAIACVDNELYGETGDQRAHTAMGTDLVAVARGCGIARAFGAADEPEIDAAAKELRSGDGPVLVVLKVSPAPAPRGGVPHSFDGVAGVLAFRRGLLGHD
jgi:phosphonopyruvate decarboxylase